MSDKDTNKPNSDAAAKGAVAPFDGNYATKDDVARIEAAVARLAESMDKAGARAAASANVPEENRATKADFARIEATVADLAENADSKPGAENVEDVIVEKVPYNLGGSERHSPDQESILEKARKKQVRPAARPQGFFPKFLWSIAILWTVICGIISIFGISQGSLIVPLFMFALWLPAWYLMDFLRRRKNLDASKKRERKRDTSSQKSRRRIIWLTGLTFAFIIMVSSHDSDEEWVYTYDGSMADFSSPYSGTDSTAVSDSFMGRQATLSQDCPAALTVREWLGGEYEDLASKGTSGAVTDTVMMSYDGSRIIKDPTNEVGHLLIRLAYPGNPNGEYGMWIESTCFGK